VRDIDPIRNPSEALLSAALNRLAKGSARQAPASLGQQLAQEFRRHHQRRRRTRAVVVLSVAACLALAVALLLTLQPSAPTAPSVARQPAPTVAPEQVSQSTSTKNRAAQERTSPAGRRNAQAIASNANENGFMPLSTYDPAMVPSELQVVRLELTGADLRLVGAPVAEDLADRRMLADIVVASDGTPYAVRLVR
jgi:hypothetical protein